MLKQKLENIKLIVADVDGTLTDGGIIISEEGVEAKCFSARDGLASNLWVKSGNIFAIVTGRKESQCVSRRAREMKAQRVVFGCMIKSLAVLALCKELEISPADTAFIGDDLPDISAMKEVGLAVAVGDAAVEVREIADFVTVNKGGSGALRELVELIMKTQGTWGPYT